MIRAPGTGRLTASISSPTAASQPSSSASRTRLSAEYQLLAWEARRVGMVSAKLGVLFSRVCIYVAGGLVGGRGGVDGGVWRGWLSGVAPWRGSDKGWGAGTSDGGVHHRPLADKGVFVCSGAKRHHHPLCTSTTTTARHVDQSIRHPRVRGGSSRL